MDFSRFGPSEPEALNLTALPGAEIHLPPLPPPNDSRLFFEVTYFAVEPQITS